MRARAVEDPERDVEVPMVAPEFDDFFAAQYKPLLALASASPR
jgi:hypothetical protein